MMRARAALAALLVAVLAVAGLRAQGERVRVSIPSGSEVLADCLAGAIYSTPSAGSLIVGCAAASPTPAATLTPSITPTDGPSPTPTVTPTPDAQWWLAGGVDPADVVGAWRAKGAASYAASLISVAGGGPLYAPIGEPTWTANKGWQGSQNNHLAGATPIYPAAGWSFFAKVRNASAASQQFMGCRTNASGRFPYGIDLNNTGGYQENNSFSPGDFGGVVLTGTMHIGGQQYYVDGALRAPTMAPPSGACSVPLMILSSNWGGSPHGGQFVTEVQGVAVYSDTLTAGQAAAIATAVAGW